MEPMNARSSPVSSFACMSSICTGVCYLEAWEGEGGEEYGGGWHSKHAHTLRSLASWLTSFIGFGINMIIDITNSIKIIEFLLLFRAAQTHGGGSKRQDTRTRNSYLFPSHSFSRAGAKQTRQSSKFSFLSPFFVGTSTTPRVFMEGICKDPKFEIWLKIRREKRNSVWFWIRFWTWFAVLGCVIVTSHHHGAYFLRLLEATQWVRSPP